MKYSFLTLTISDWLAIIGACSWLPTIINWIKEYYTKPKLTIITGNQIEIGFTSFGPIINLGIAFLSETKKSIIKKIELELVHENNDTQFFSWMWFEEILYSMDLPDLQQINTKRNQNANAVRIGIDELVEKKVGFQQNIFKNEYDKLNKQLLEDGIQLFQMNKNLEDLKLQSSYRKLQELLKNSFNWKVGKYKVKIKAHISSNDLKFNHEFDFTLNSLDIKLLSANIENCQLNIDKSFINSNIETKQWQWINTTKSIN